MIGKVFRRVPPLWVVGDDLLVQRGGVPAVGEEGRATDLRPANGTEGVLGGAVYR